MRVTLSKITDKREITRDLTLEQFASLCLECCGGGYTTEQTAEAILTQQQLKLGVIVTTTTGYILKVEDEDDAYAPNDRVITEHGPGAIVEKDMCRRHVDKPELGVEWSGRWVVLHDELPPNRPWMKAGEMLAYWPKDLKREPKTYYNDHPIGNCDHCHKPMQVYPEMNHTCVDCKLKGEPRE